MEVVLESSSAELTNADFPLDGGCGRVPPSPPPPTSAATAAREGFFGGGAVGLRPAGLSEGRPGLEAGLDAVLEAGGRAFVVVGRFSSSSELSAAATSASEGFCLGRATVLSFGCGLGILKAKAVIYI